MFSKIIESTFFIDVLELFQKKHKLIITLILIPRMKIQLENIKNGAATEAKIRAKRRETYKKAAEKKRAIQKTANSSFVARMYQRKEEKTEWPFCDVPTFGWLFKDTKESTPLCKKLFEEGFTVFKIGSETFTSFMYLLASVIR